jgi:hypothetical protein
MFVRRNAIAQRLLSGVDLLMDLATLGEYGLEPLPADGPCRERARSKGAPVGRPGTRPAWEASTTARRGACEQFDWIDSPARRPALAR